MDPTQIVLGLFLSGGEVFVEDLMELPPCPLCEQGRLLPFSDDNKPFAFWICSLPGCGYAIGQQLTSKTYYKGTAAFQQKEKGEKRYVEYEF